MVQIIQARNLTIGTLIDKFGLQQAKDEQFFTEWIDDLAKHTAVCNILRFLNSAR